MRNFGWIAAALLACCFAAPGCKEEKKEEPKKEEAKKEEPKKDEKAEERAKWIKDFTGHVDAICKCADIECFGKVNDEIQKMKNPSTEPTEAEKKTLEAQTKRLEECAKKFAPKPAAEGSASAAPSGAASAPHH